MNVRRMRPLLQAPSAVFFYFLRMNDCQDLAGDAEPQIMNNVAVQLYVQVNTGSCAEGGGK